MPNPDPAAILREALADYERSSWRGGDLARVCLEHLPALLSELAQLRSWKLAVDEVGPDHALLKGIAVERRDAELIINDAKEGK